MLAIERHMWDGSGEAFLRTLAMTTSMFLAELSTGCDHKIGRRDHNVNSQKVLLTVSLRSRIKTRPSKLAPSTEIKGQTYSAAVEPSNPRMVKANWFGSKLIDLDKNLASVMRLEKRQQGFMETWIGFGQRILSTGPSGLP